MLTLKFIKQKPKQKHLILAASLACVDLLFFGSTNISNVSSFMVIAAFLLMSLSFFAVLYYFLSFLRLYGIRVERRRRLSVYGTVAIGILLALQSIGELSIKDILVLLPLTVISYVYLGYAKANEQKIS